MTNIYDVVDRLNTVTLDFQRGRWRETDRRTDRQTDRESRGGGGKWEAGRRKRSVETEKRHSGLC